MRCKKCGSTNIADSVVDSIDRQPCEIAYSCGDCGSYVDYWAYGIYESETEEPDDDGL